MVSRIVDEVQKLAEEPLPHGSEKLTGSERTYRIRVGDYRVVYTVRDDELTVLVVRIAHRKDVYKA